MSTNDALIFDAIRTPRGRGKASGALHEVKPITLLVHLLKELHGRHQFDTSAVDDIVMGCVSAINDQGETGDEDQAQRGQDHARCAADIVGRHHHGVDQSRRCKKVEPEGRARHAAKAVRITHVEPETGGEGQKAKDERQ